MAFYCQCMLEIALILCRVRPDVRGGRLQVRPALHVDRLRDGPHRRATTTRCGTRRTASSTTCCGCPTARRMRLKVRSMVGLLPLCASTVFEADVADALSEADGDDRAVPEAPSRSWCRTWRRPTRGSSATRAGGCCRSSTRRSWSACSATCSTRTSFSARTASARSRAITWTIRSSFWVGGQEYKVQYLPAESNTGMFGGNSNWRGPVWMPVNVLIVRALLNLYGFYGDDFKVECPTGSGQYMTLFEVAQEISRRLASTFLRDAERPAAGLRRHREVPGRSALARSDPVLRVLPRRQRRRARRQPPDGVDRPGRSRCSTCSGASTPKPPRNRTRPVARPHREGAGGRRACWGLAETARGAVQMPVAHVRKRQSR